MPTPHINAQKGDFAKIVLMPGDPKRATWIAETFLHDYKLVNEVRGALAYTGYTKNGKKLSVMASGMGMPSMAIYSHELFAEYDVEAIIRIGTMGVYQEDIALRDVVIGLGACTDSSAPELPGHFAAIGDWELNEALVNATKEHNLPVHVGNVLSSNYFYDYDKDLWKKWKEYGVLGVEMEAHALYMNAAKLHKRAACICTATDHFVRPERLSAEERQEGLVNMVEVAIAAAEKIIAKESWDE